MDAGNQIESSRRFLLLKRRDIDSRYELQNPWRFGLTSYFTFFLLSEPSPKFHLVHCWMTRAGLSMRGSNEFMQDAALSGDMPCLAARPQRDELLLQRAHGLEPRPRPRQLIVDQPVDVAAVGIRMSDEIEQPLDLGQRHVERPAVPDKGQPLQVRGAIGAVAVA